MTSAGVSSRARVRRVVSAARRIWWLTPLLVGLVALASLVQYFGPGAAQREVYIATRALRITIVPIGSASAYDSYIAARHEDEIARSLAPGGLLSNARLDTAIAARVRANGGASPPSARDVAAALSATHTGNLLILSARAHTRAQADALAAAAAETLRSPDLAALLPQALAPPTGTTVVVLSEGSVSPPALDPAPQQAALLQLTARLALGLLVGILLTAIVAIRTA